MSGGITNVGLEVAGFSWCCWPTPVRLVLTGFKLSVACSEGREAPAIVRCHVVWPARAGSYSGLTSIGLDMTSAIHEGVGSAALEEAAGWFVFPARIKRVIVFKPLDSDAMTGIARMLFADMADEWRHKRQKQLEVAEEVVAWVAREAHDRNEHLKGKNGGRIVRKLIADLVEAEVQRAIAADPDRYGRSGCVRVAFGGERSEDDRPGVQVEFA